MFSKKKPLYCKPEAVIKAFEVDIENDTTIENLTFEYYGNIHKVGVNCYISTSGKRIDHGFYLDNQRFNSLERFVTDAMIEGIPFIELELIALTKSEEHGHPRNNGVLAHYEIKNLEKEIRN